MPEIFSTKKVFSKILLHQIPRILSQLDRDKDSLTYGSFDRSFWHFKIRDFSSAILQQPILILALLYKNNFKENIYYQNNLFKEWAIAGINFWCEIQLKNGGFNEYYPNEAGFPPTAFSLYAVTETCKILELKNQYVNDCI